jgi:hypothetical protein
MVEMVVVVLVHSSLTAKSILLKSLYVDVTCLSYPQTVGMEFATLLSYFEIPYPTPSNFSCFFCCRREEGLELLNIV